MKENKPKEKILIADDKLTIINLLSTALETEGYEVISTTTGQQVVSMAVQSRPDLILLDVLMPDQDGFETCERLKGDDETKGIPIIFMTGLVSVNDKIRAFQAGGIDYITKPVELDEVLMRVKLHLSFHNLQKQLVAQNTHLHKEITDHQMIEDALNKENKVLENRIKETSVNLLAENRRLKLEIEDREEVEEAIKGSEKKFRIAIENSNDAIAFVENGVHKYVNETYTKLFGYNNPDELLAEPLSKTICRDQQEQKENSQLSDRLFKDPISKYECQGLRKNGQVLALEISETITYLRKQEISIISVRDIKEHKKPQKFLRHLQKMETIGTLAGGIAHDFNNILGIIIGCSQLSLSLPEVKEDTDLNNHLEHILKAGFRAKDLVQQILFFSQQKEGERKPLQIDTIIKEALKMLRASLPSTIAIRQEIDHQVGKVLADVIQIHQVILSLCSNAAHTMRQNGGTLGVSLKNIILDEPDSDLSHLSPGPYVLLTVSDTGKGMDEAQRQRIFEPFIAYNGIKESTGLGLATVHEIIQSNQGAIRVNSKLGQGSVFEVFIPQIAEVHQPETAIKGFKKTGKECGRILFIDDDLTLMKVSELMLKRLGYSVESYNNSTEALNFFSKNPDHFDLVLTDMTMPGMTGLTLAQKILQIRPEIPVFLCTGFSEQVTEEQAKDYGIREFLIKPINLNLLAEKLAKCLNRGSELAERGSSVLQQYIPT